VTATIVFAMLQESGHLNPTFRIARCLRERGIDVCYFARADLAPVVERQGFRTLPWFPELYPKGSSEADAALPKFQQRRRITQNFERMARILAEGQGPLAALRGLPAPHVLVDVTQPLMAFALRKAGLPFQYINTSLPQTHDGAVPPLRTGLPATSSLRTRLRNQLAWRRFGAQRLVSAALAAPFGMCPTYALTAVYARRFGLRAKDLELTTTYLPQLRNVPELVLCPSAFDFPRPPRSGRTYGESIDLARNEAPLELGTLDPESPLVYASLGSQLYAAAEGRSFLQRLVRAVATRPDLSLLLSLGRHMRPEDLGTLPQNVHAVQSAPQLAVLQKASAMLTHGGLGSIKECLYFGVPMLVCPLDVDQPGNAARVVHHGAGLRTALDEQSDAKILGMLDALLRDPAIRERIGVLQREIRSLEAQAPGAAQLAAWCTLPA
jgi:UDP:flavonoid glycosyltransferase YjiC (YdhE family)